MKIIPFFLASLFFNVLLTDAKDAVVVSGSQESCDIGIELLSHGGNAADTAIAVSLALGVSEPFGSGLGGKIALLYYEQSTGEVHFIEGLDQAPNEFPVDEYQNGSYELRSQSFQSVCTPGLLPSLWNLHQRFGTKDWKDLVLPAATLAHNGFIVDKHSAAIFQRSERMLKANPETRRLYTIDGLTPEAGDRLANPDLAATLERLAYNGIREFREGATAHMLAKAMVDEGGWITLNDLRDYKSKTSAPLSASWKQYEVYTADSPISGGASVLLALKALETINPSTNALSAERFDLLGRTLKSVYPRVYRSFGDDESRQEERVNVFSRQSITGLRKAIEQPLEANVSSYAPAESADDISGQRSTTHFVVVDLEGNVACVTQSLSSRFGSSVIAPGTGFLLNNTMKNFALNTKSSPNYIGKGKRPRSTISPTIILENGLPRLALGAPGGQRIPTAVVQIITAVLMYDSSLEDAINGPRYHLRRPLSRKDSDRTVEMEPTYGSKEAEALKAYGWDVHFVSPEKYYFGTVNSVYFEPETQHPIGVADPRRSGHTAYFTE
jgi:gamma-glutamyltranspeptidase/glutathione hydrolase